MPLPLLDEPNPLRAALACLATHPESLDPQGLDHCADSIEYARRGYPLLKPRWFRTLIGPVAARVFIRRRRLGHDLQAAIPGGAASESRDIKTALGRLERVIGELQAHRGALPPHFAYGNLKRADIEKLQALHLVDHFANCFSGRRI